MRLFWTSKAKTIHGETVRCEWWVVKRNETPSNSQRKTIALTSRENIFNNNLRLTLNNTS